MPGRTSFPPKCASFSPPPLLDWACCDRQEAQRDDHRDADNGDFTPSSGNVFADLGLPDPDLLLAKAEFAIAITSIIRERGLTQTAAARELGVHQSRISAISRGRLDDFSLERLMNLARRLGQDIEIRMAPSAEPTGHTTAQLQRVEERDEVWPADRCQAFDPGWQRPAMAEVDWLH